MLAPLLLNIFSLMHAIQTSILIVDDDNDLRDLLQQYLTQENFNVYCAASGAEMDRQLQLQQIDIIVLDLMMPVEDGLSILRRVRPEISVPVIILSAKGQDMDRIIGLEVGADDYLSKPFNPRELLARIRAVLRRSSEPRNNASHSTAQTIDDRLVFGNNQFNKKTGELIKAGIPVALTDSEVQMLTLFTSRMDETLSRDTIMDALHGRDRDPFDRSIDIHITRLRKKVEDDPSHPEFIRTVWAKGYKFTPNSD